MTSLIHDKVIPQIVGGDIGCGISCINLKKVIKEKHYEKIDAKVKELIPMGELNHRVPVVTEDMMNCIYDQCNHRLEKIKPMFPDYPFGDFKFSDNYYKALIKRAKSNVAQAIT